MRAAPVRDLGRNRFRRRDVALVCAQVVNRHEGNTPRAHLDVEARQLRLRRRDEAGEVEARITDAGQDQQAAFSLRRRDDWRGAAVEVANRTVGRRRSGAHEQQGQGPQNGTGRVWHGAQYRKGSDFPSLFVITGCGRPHSVAFFATLTLERGRFHPGGCAKMAQIGLLVTELKRYLKAQGVTYAALAKQLGLSESSIKRQFARQSFSLARLEQILNLVGLEIADLIA